MVRRNWAYRTVRNGTVRIDGVDYYPDDSLTYNGELDGMRLLFGRYYTGDVVEPHIYLWGTEAKARAFREGAEYTKREPNQFDGVLRWTCWRQAPSTAPPDAEEVS